MKILKRLISWLLFNGLLIISVWFGVINGNSNWANVASFVIWILMLSGMFVWLTKDTPAIKPELSKMPISGLSTVGLVIDLIVLFSLVYFGWITHAIIFLIYIVFETALREFRKKLAEENKVKTEEKVNA